MMAHSVSLNQSIPSDSLGGDKPTLEDTAPLFSSIPERIPVDFSDAPSACWLCPIQSSFQHRGILQMTAADYFDLVDQSGRILRSDKRGTINADLAPILLRIGANPDAWVDTISHFGSKFRLAAGLLSNLRNFAHQLGRRWLIGVTTARAAFAVSPPQLA